MNGRTSVAIIFLYILLSKWFNGSRIKASSEYDSICTFLLNLSKWPQKEVSAWENSSPRNLMACMKDITILTIHYRHLLSMIQLWQSSFTVMGLLNHDVLHLYYNQDHKSAGT